MKRNVFLLSLLAIFLFSCQNETDNVLPQKAPEIKQLEEDYGVTFEKIAGEVDTSNVLFIPFEELEQFFENVILNTRSIPTTTNGTGKFSYGRMYFSFLEVWLSPNRVDILFDFPLYSNSTSSLNLQSCFFCEWFSIQFVDSIRGPIGGEQINNWTQSIYPKLSREVKCSLSTVVGGTWYNLSYKIYFELRPLRNIVNFNENFTASLTVSYNF